MKPRLLDLFCGAGGATCGYQKAGFYVIGVDHVDQPNYCGDEFVQDDALSLMSTYPWWDVAPFDAIHASPPCQAYTPLSNRWRGQGGMADERPDLIAETRRLLRATGLPYVIENVVGAPLEAPVRVCGMSLGIGAHRHRLFESNLSLMVPPCSAQGKSAAVYGKLDGRRLFTRKDGSELRAATLTEAREALGIDWMEDGEIQEAVPPAFTEMLGHQLLNALRARQAA